MFLFACRCGVSLTKRPGLVLSCCTDLYHEHICTIGRPHTQHEPCLCSCGATMAADEDFWREHEHRCIVATEHSKFELCHCSCGFIRDMLDEGVWEEPDHE